MSAERVICASHLSSHPRTDEAIQEVCHAVRQTLGDRFCTLAVVFASPHHVAGFDTLASRIRAELGAERLLGCTGEAIIGTQAGTGRELEEEPALSVFAAHLPRTTTHPFHVTIEQRDNDLALHGWPQPLKTGGQTPVVLLLPDPFSSAPSLLLDQFAEHYPGAPVVGGIASGGLRPGKNRLFLDDDAHEAGAIGVLLWGPPRVRAVVSQGCRAIGRHLVITRAEQNVILELAGKPAFEQFQELFGTLDDDDRELARTALHVGRVINEAQAEFGPGDFLMRNIVGIDPDGGAIMLNDKVRVGQTVQFHVRDAGTATHDLDLLLAREAAGSGDIAGALLFSCNGRGTRMFDIADHDAAALGAHLGQIPLAGFFAQGELGPVGGQNFLHGFTASMALFHGAVATDDDRETS